MSFPIVGEAAVEGLHAGLFVSNGDPGIRHPRRTLAEHELILVRSGELGIREGRTEHRVGPGQVLLLTAGREHAGTVDYPADLSFYWLHFRWRRAPGRGAPELPTVGTPRRPELLTGLLHRYLDDLATGAADALGSGLLVHLILAEAAQPAREPVDRSSSHLVGRAEAWIGQHYRDGMSTRDLARHLGCTADHIGRVFHRVTGATVVDTINRRRLQDAANRLLIGGDEIVEVARQVGFRDTVHFRRLFKRRFGITPGAYRTLHARAYVNSD